MQKVTFNSEVKFLLLLTFNNNKSIFKNTKKNIETRRKTEII